MESPKSPSPVEVTWIFSAEVLEHCTPSRDHGISVATEKQYRREGARFIINSSNTLKLRRDTLATGAVFYHRFFMVQSFKDFDRWVVAATCVMLAGKVEETPKKCKDIIKVAQQLLTAEQFKAFGNDAKEQLFSHERVLMQTIRFDLQVYHPYDYLLKFAESLKGEKSRIERVLQMAWTFINDSLCTTLCMQWEPSVIAVATLYLAGKLSRFDLQTAMQVHKRSWWRQFVDTVDIHDLESICHQVLDVYSEEEKETTATATATANKVESTEDNSSSQPVSSSAPDIPPPPPPPPPPQPQSTQSTHSTQLPNSTHMSYTSQSLQQAMIAMGGSHVQAGHIYQSVLSPQNMPKTQLPNTSSFQSVLGRPPHPQPSVIFQPLPQVIMVGVRPNNQAGGIPRFGTVIPHSSTPVHTVVPQPTLFQTVRPVVRPSIRPSIRPSVPPSLPPSSHSHHHNYHSGAWR